MHQKFKNLIGKTIVDVRVHNSHGASMELFLDDGTVLHVGEADSHTRDYALDGSSKVFAVVADIEEKG